MVLRGLYSLVTIVVKLFVFSKLYSKQKRFVTGKKLKKKMYPEMLQKVAFSHALWNKWIEMRFFHYFYFIFTYPISQQFWMRKSPRKRPRTLQQFQVPLGSCWRQQSPFSFLPFLNPKEERGSSIHRFPCIKLEILIFKAVKNSMRTFYAKINLR